MATQNFAGIFILLLFFNIKIYGQTDIPPTLIYPSNGQLIQEAFPSLSWTKAYPANLPVVYEIKIVEILPNQSPESAILSNPEWYFNDNLSRNLLMYPSTAPLLQTGRKYAWQVVAKHTNKTESGNEVRVLPSEVFWFETKDLNEKKICIATPLASDQKDEIHYVLEDYILRFKLLNEDQEQTLACKFVNINQEPLPIKAKVIPKKVKPAEYYQIPLRQFKIFRQKSSKNKFYYLKASTKTGKNYYVKFTY